MPDTITADAAYAAEGFSVESAPPFFLRPAPVIATVTASLLAFAVWWVATSGAYTSGDSIGYNLGLAGGILMLVLFVYPLRKRVRALTAIGPIRHYFSLHMALGIAGPVLILLHSRFHLGSLNAAIAFWSMVLVSSSGIVGRFLYRQIHHGLYGRKTSMEELRARAGIGEGETTSWLKHLPDVKKALSAFGAHAEQAAALGLASPVKFFTLGVQAHRTAREARSALIRDLPIVARARQWDEDTYRRRLNKGERLIRIHLAHIRGISQFSVYERLFALWHLLHLPFVYMLFFTAIAHVVAVHMY
jgi:hypothetical protein